MLQKNQKNNLKYSDISDIVEYLVRAKAYKYTFDCWELDDIAQEIRLICFKALEKYDGSRVVDNKLINYFGTCVDNALKNLKRDKYIRMTPNCCSPDCELSHGEENTDREICPRWSKYNEKIRSQRVIKHPLSIDAIGNHVNSANFEENLEMEDIKEYLIKNIDRNLRSGLLNILGGNKKEVDIKNRRKIQEFVKKALG